MFLNELVAKENFFLLQSLVGEVYERIIGYMYIEHCNQYLRFDSI